MTVQNIEVVGKLLTDAGRVVVQLEGVYNTHPADLWSALTEPHRLARWLARVEGDLRLGGTFRAFLESTDEHAVGNVVVCDPPRRLHVTWRTGDGEEDEQTLIAVELLAEGDRTRLVLQERGVQEMQAAGYGAGWHAHLESLGAHLAGERPADWHRRWQEMLPAYRAQTEGLT